MSETSGGNVRTRTETALVKAEPQSETSTVAVDALDVPRRREHFFASRKWVVRLAVLSLVLLTIAFFIWRSQRPVAVTLVQPNLTTITETIASSGRVGGETETLVGAQAQGIVESLYVEEGDRVAAGQRLAVLKNNVVEAQVTQAEQSVRTAQAQLSQVARGPLSSEIQTATEQVRQAQAQVTQQQAAISQAQKAVTQARAQLNQLRAERDLAAKELERSRTLVNQGIVPQSEYDQAQTNLRVAEERVTAQQGAVELAESGVRQSRAALRAAQANVRAQQATLQTVRSGARPEDVQVARQRLREAEQALIVARQQAANSIVTAPFAGVVTEINAELGQTVGSQGVLELVSGEFEIRLDVDENNLSDLRLGQTAIISSSTFSEGRFEATVTEIGAAVDEARGTIEVTVTPANPPDWLRPGQTVNVNIITAKNAQRLLVPLTALARDGDRTVVYVVQDGVALQKTVVTRPPTEEGVPVLAGLSAGDRIIADVRQIKPGDAVRVKETAG